MRQRAGLLSNIVIRFFGWAMRHSHGGEIQRYIWVFVHHIVRNRFFGKAA